MHIANCKVTQNFQSSRNINHQAYSPKQKKKNTCQIFTEEKNVNTYTLEPLALTTLVLAIFSYLRCESHRFCPDSPSSAISSCLLLSPAVSCCLLSRLPLVLCPLPRRGLLFPVLSHRLLQPVTRRPPSVRLSVPSGPVPVSTVQPGAVTRPGPARHGTARQHGRKC